MRHGLCSSITFCNLSIKHQKVIDFSIFVVSHFPEILHYYFYLMSIIISGGLIAFPEQSCHAMVSPPGNQGMISSASFLLVLVHHSLI